jgi:hypothetical protein
LTLCFLLPYSRVRLRPGVQDYDPPLWDVSQMKDADLPGIDEWRSFYHKEEKYSFEGYLNAPDGYYTCQGACRGPHQPFTSRAPSFHTRDHCNCATARRCGYVAVRGPARVISTNVFVFHCVGEKTERLKDVEARLASAAKVGPRPYTTPSTPFVVCLDGELHPGTAGSYCSTWPADANNPT